MKRYTINYNRIIIHKGTGYIEYYPRQSFYRTCIDIIGTICDYDNLYYHIITDYDEKIKLRK